MKKEQARQKEAKSGSSEILIFHNKRSILFAVKQVSSLGKILGLMFHPKSTQNLLFAFSEDSETEFHSLFVFFPFLMLWLDEKKNVIEWRIVEPFSTAIRAGKKFRYVVEIPCNEHNAAVCKLFVGKERFK